MTVIELRPAEPEDLGAIAALMDAAYAEDRERLDGLPDMTEGLAAELREHDTMVAVRGGVMLGVIIVATREGALLIINLAVAPDARGVGLGTRLLQWAEAVARARGCRTLALKTHAGMTKTRSLYMHLGWTETGVSGKVVSLEKPLAGGEG